MKEQSFKKEVFTDFIQMTILFLTSVMVVYFGGNIIRDLFFIIPLILAFRSKKDYFWFAYFFILINGPAGFFVNKYQLAEFRLPFYSIIPKFSMMPMDVFLFISIFKAIRTKVKIDFFLNKPLEFFLVYLIFVSIPVSFVLGTEFKVFLNTFRSFFFYGIIFAFLRLINSKEEILKFGYLIIPYSILIVFDQLFLVKTNTRFIALLDTSLGQFALNHLTGDIRATTPGTLLVFYTLIFGFQISNLKKFEIFPGIANIAIFIAAGSFFLEGTRSWMTIGAIGILGYVYLSNKGMKFLFQITIIGTLLVIILLSLDLISDKFINSIITRYSELGKMASSGNFKQGTFADRITNDIPQVLKGLAHSPVLGVGLSKYMRIYYSNDLGFVNTILIYGLIGFPVFMFFLFRYMFHLKKLINLKYFDQADKNILISLLLGFGCMLIGYLLTVDFFSVYSEKVFFVSILFATGDLILRLHDEHLENESP